MTATISDTAVIDDNFDIEEPKRSGKKGLWTLILFIILIAIGFVLVKDPFGQSAKVGDTVVVSYIASYDNGKTYEERSMDNPLSFTLGQDQVIPGIEEAIFGMRVNKNKKFVVSPEDGFAKYYDPAQKQTLPAILFEQLDIEPVIGSYYDLGNVKGFVIAIEGKGNNQKIILDTNPLQTWQDLHYELTLLDISKD